VVDLGPAPSAHRTPQRRQGEALIEAASQFPAPDAAGEHVHGMANWAVNAYDRLEGV